jgi:hypothetical protein
VQKQTYPDYFNDEFHYSASKDPFAFGITSFGQKQEPLNEDFGSITVKYEQWNEDEDIWIDLKIRPCSLADFGLDSKETAPSNSTFFTPLEKK